MKKDLISNDLFGNEAGEDEELEVLNSYFVEKDDFNLFYSEKNKFRIINSRKGVGKSSLLRKTYYLMINRPDTIAIYLKGSDLVALQRIEATNPNEYIFGWQQRICSRINVELGRIIKMALSDDAMTLVESSELAGFKGRNVVSSLVDRLKTKYVERIKLQSADSQQILQRYSENKNLKVWLFVDDIDATFRNNEQEKIEISTFFSACRNLINDVKGLYIRASVRTDVWTTLEQYDEALDKCKQYVCNLIWSTSETGNILGNKILSYFQREYQGQYRNLSISNDLRKIFNLVFTPGLPWGNNRVLEPFRPIHILSNGRPRWAAQLCKMAGLTAYKRKKDIIGISEISSNLSAFGKSRLNDLYKEHSHQCPSLDRIIESFSGGNTKYSSNELLSLITQKIIRQFGTPEIDGQIITKGSLSVAFFLFRIGFIYGRHKVNESLYFIRYEDRPNLLSTTQNLDDSHIWEVHPSFRDVLKLSKNT